MTINHLFKLFIPDANDISFLSRFNAGSKSIKNANNNYVNWNAFSEKKPDKS